MKSDSVKDEKRFIHFQVDARDEERIARLLKETELPSKSAVIRAALKSFEASIQQGMAKV